VSQLFQPLRHRDKAALPFRRALPRRAVAVCLALIAVWAVVATAQLPRSPGREALDESWQLVLSVGVVKGWHFGRDLVFTFGPLGWLENRVQVPTLFWPEIAWQLVSRTAVVVLLASWLGFGWRFAVAALLLGALCSTRSFLPMPDAFYFFACWLAGVTLVRDTANFRWPSALALALLSAFALLKFTLGIAAVAIFGVVVCIAARRRHAAGVYSVIVGSAVLWCAGWLATGQSFADIPPYLSGSWAVASSYSAAMARDLFRPERAFLAAMAVSLLIALAVATRERVGRAVIVMTAVLLPLVWRHALSRPDSFHLSNVFVWTALVAVAWPRASRLAFIVCGATLTAWLAAYSPSYLWKVKASDAVGAVDFVRTLLSPRRAFAAFRADFDRASAAAALPRSREVVGTACIDVHGYDQSRAILAGFNFVPRPVPQSYSAYDEVLIAGNRRAIEHLAPPFSLVQLATIDNRVPTADDSAALALMLSRDEVRLEESGMLLLQRANKPRVSSPAPALVTTLALNEWYETPARREDVTVARLELTPTLLRRLLEGSVPLPPTYLDLRFADGRIESYRLPWTMARAGWVLTPFLHTTAELKTWYASPESILRVRAFRLRQAGARWLFAPSMTLTLTGT
jgi:hypothetical protein